MINNNYKNNELQAFKCTIANPKKHINTMHAKSSEIQTIIINTIDVKQRMRH